MASLKVLESEYVLLNFRIQEHEDAIGKLQKRMAKKADAIVEAGGDPDELLADDSEESQDDDSQE